LVQKLKLLLIFQTLDLQNLVNFGHRKDLHFQFQICANLEKNLNGRALVPAANDGPWPRVQPACAHMQPCRCASATTCHLVSALSVDDRRLPVDIHVRRAAGPYGCRDQGKKQSSFLFHEDNTASTLSLYRSFAIAVSHRCPAPVDNELSHRFLRSRALELFSKPCSDPVPGHQEPKSLSSFLEHQAPPVDSPHRPSSSPTDPGNSFTRAPSYSTTSSPTTLTPPQVQRHHSPPADHPPPLSCQCAEPLPLPSPKSSSPHTPACSGYRDPPPRHRRWPDFGRRATDGEKGGNPLFSRKLVHQPGNRWLVGRARPKPIGLMAQRHSSLFFFPFG
jgi:hypothetical protein